MQVRCTCTCTCIRPRAAIAWKEVNGTVGIWRELGQTVRAALATWHGTARLGVLLILGSVAGAVFLAVAAWLKH